MEKFLKIWCYIISILLVLLMVIMLFVSSEGFYTIVTKIIIPVAIFPYLICSFIYYKLGGHGLVKTASKVVGSTNKTSNEVAAAQAALSACLAKAKCLCNPRCPDKSSRTEGIETTCSNVCLAERAALESAEKAYNVLLTDMACDAAETTATSCTGLGGKIVSWVKTAVGKVSGSGKKK